jgi:hypothetical protein
VTAESPAPHQSQDSDGDYRPPSLARRAEYKAFALVRLMVAVVVLGGVLGVGIGYGVGHLFGGSQEQTALVQAGPPRHEQPLAVTDVVAISQDGKAHWHNGVGRVSDSDKAHGIVSVSMASAAATHSQMLGLKFQIHPGTAVTKVVVTLGHGGPQTLWLIAADKGDAKAAYDAGHRVATYQGAGATVTLTPAQPVAGSDWFELLFPKVPPQPGHDGQFSTSVLEVTFYGVAN